MTAAKWQYPRDDTQVDWVLSATERDRKSRDTTRITTQGSNLGCFTSAASGMEPWTLLSCNLPSTLFLAYFNSCNRWMLLSENGCGRSKSAARRRAAAILSSQELDWRRRLFNFLKEALDPVEDEFNDDVDSARGREDEMYENSSSDWHWRETNSVGSMLSFIQLILSAFKSSSSISKAWTFGILQPNASQYTLNFGRSQSR